MPDSHGKNQTDVRSSENALQRELDELREGGSLLAEILDTTPVGTICIDESQCITLFNRGAEQIFGFHAEEIIGKSLTNLLPNQFRLRHAKHVKRFARSGIRSRKMDERNRVMGLRKDGSQFPVKASISKLKHHGATMLAVSLLDMTEIEQAEEAARQSREEVAHLSRMGVLGEISASLAHELNQPLAAILTNAQVLQRQLGSGALPEETTEETLIDVVEDARRAGEVIQRLRNLIRPGPPPSAEPLNINQVITTVDHMLHSQLVMKQVNVSIELESELPAVTGDFIQLQQVLLNLFTNAVDAMEQVAPSNRHLQVSASRTADKSVQISFKDNGSGFGEEAQVRMLEPFFTTKDRGMGMGLAISNSIMKAHGGRLWAENNAGAGATFYISLPADGEATNAQRPEQEQEQTQTQKSLPDTSTVFVVDDDSSVRRALYRMLSSAGYSVEAFASALEFEQREPHTGNGCLIVDLHMPGGTGLDLQKKLNSRPYTMPIIFLTGAGDTTSGVNAIKQGAMDFLTKPVDEEELLEAIKCAIEHDVRGREKHLLRVSAEEKIARLTSREHETMELVVKGLLNKQIGVQLGISEKTVKVHRSRVMEKIEANSVTDLVRVFELANNPP